MLRKAYRVRIKLLYFIPFFYAALLIPRLYFLQVVKWDYFRTKADHEHLTRITVMPSRGRILDSREHELASSTQRMTPWIKQKNIPMAAVYDLAPELAATLNIDAKVVVTALTTPTQNLGTTITREMPLAHKIDEDEVKRVSVIFAEYAKKYKVMKDALLFKYEGKRSYPQRELASQVVGFTATNDEGDNQGIAGIEKIYDAKLCGQHEVSYVTRMNAARDPLDPIDSELLATTYGNDVVLTIDDQIQKVTEDALAKQVVNYKADCGTAVVYGIKTGEVLALASYPTFSLSSVKTATREEKFNRAVEHCIEPGSVMKIFTFASLIEDHKVTPDTIIDCQGGTLVLATRTIKDTHSLGQIPVKEIFAQSSNVGTIKAASGNMTQTEFYHHLYDDFGFGRRTKIDLPGESPGRLDEPRKWTSMSMSSIPIGYEIQVTAIQVAAAASAIVNKGYYMQPHVVKEIRDYHGNTITKVDPRILRKVVSDSTSRQMLSMMEGVVTHGTGKQASLADYNVGGKTGTTKKLDPHTHKYYSDKYITSFCGVAPLEDPEICIYIWIDNPEQTKGIAFGGTVAAPVFKEIAESALHVLKIPPTSLKSSVKTTDVAQKTKTPKPTKEVAAISFDEPRDDDTVCSGSMPNLVGLSMIEAAEKLKSLGIAYRFEGTGVVMNQTPKAYETVEKNEAPAIFFAPKPENVAKLAKGDWGSDVDPESVVSQPVAIETPSLKLTKSGHLVSLSLAPGARMPSVSNKGPVATPTPLPDLDTYANKEPNSAKEKELWSRTDFGNGADSKKKTPEPPQDNGVAADTSAEPAPTEEVPPAPSEETIKSLYDVIGGSEQ